MKQYSHKVAESKNGCILSFQDTQADASEQKEEWVISAISLGMPAEDAIARYNLSEGEYEKYAKNLENMLSQYSYSFPEYRGYKGEIKYSSEDGRFYGKILGMRSLLLFEGESIDDLELDFKSLVDEYLTECQEAGVKPEKPNYSEQ